MRNSCTSVSPNTRAWEQQERNKIKKRTKKVIREAEYRKKQSRREKKNPHCLSHPTNENIIIINKIFIFYKIWKKYNEIQLTKNKIDLNSRKMTNHPPSSVQKSLSLYNINTSLINEVVSTARERKR